MKCVKCNSELPDGAKFCNACGASQEPAKCVKCGAELPAGAKFCNGCGASQEAPKTEEMKKCARCGTEMPKDFKFCDGCGASQEAAQVPPPVQQQVPPPVQQQVPPPQYAQRPQQQYAPAAPQAPAGPQKSRTTYQILALLFGGLGIHNFYAGYTGRGIAQLLLCWTGISSIWALIEVFVVSKDAKGVPMRPSELSLILLIMIFVLVIGGTLLNIASYYTVHALFPCVIVSGVWACIEAIAVSKNAKAKGVPMKPSQHLIILLILTLIGVLVRFVYVPIMLMSGWRW